ncbi:hypothetical protein [Pleomorphomonas koreensis]|uniref:hypothetical protein n=1 Tax=Pleomorphomonas koreensis TaxID=257440 RepID=UPI00047B0073|nr:hypothetical protein [Pleomorphomonas koreensis]
MRGDRLTVARSRHAAGDPGNLVQTVAEVDERHAFHLQLFDALEETKRLLAAERSGLFVEDQQAGVQRQRLGDLHLLLGGDLEIADKRGRSNIEAGALALLGGAPIDADAIDPSPARRKRSAITPVTAIWSMTFRTVRSVRNVSDVNARNTQSATSPGKGLAAAVLKQVLQVALASA